ncbi:Sieve element occlusion [Quillaja saponaria]|uniref:Sieve element occlusion n=1 Tax=Quillaja saponaria TaxID=32244 RepID=A0AAD7LIF3_QUISA|nr:Sieve element occlusion [Quillaja saponaria]
MNMKLLKGHKVSLCSHSTTEEDILIRKLLLMHDPDGRWLDSELLLHAVEKIMLYASTSEVVVPKSKNNISNIEVIGLSSQEPLGYTIKRISCKILCILSGEGDLHSRTMGLFDLLENYRWDAKVVLVLAAFATRYGEFCLLMQLYPHNPLAALLAKLKQLPSDLWPLKPLFKALSLLMKTMVDVANCIIQFEALPHSDIQLDHEALLVTKSHIYLAVYWVTRSTLTCFSQITDFRIMKQKYSDSTVIAAWELSSLACRLNRICCVLRQQVDLCHQEMERKMHEKLLNLFYENHLDNQEVLRMLFALKGDLPFKDCSSHAKLGVSALKNKIVMLLISKPELLTFEELHSLVQQTFDHPLNDKLEDSYKIVWVPLPSSDTWTEAEETSFNFQSNSLPWYSVRKPRLIGSAVVKNIQEQWNYKGEPLIVVLDSNGKVTHSNAFDMVMIWGPKAYPFSASKEAELWKDEKLAMQLMVDDIDPLLAHWFEEGRNLCIYGSDNIEWVQEFNAKMEELKQAGVQLEMVYVGCSNFSEHVKDIMSTIPCPLSIPKLHFFWLRIRSMRRSKLRLGKTSSSDYVLEELVALLDINDNKGWAVIGSGTSKYSIKLQGSQIMECLNKFPEWKENVEKLGLIPTIRIAFEPPLARPCNHSYEVPFAQVEGLVEGTVFCEICKYPMKKFVVYE